MARKKTPKTIKTRACASGRAYAKGPRKGNCVPTKPGKWCWAASKKAAAEQLKLYDKRKASAAHMRAVMIEKRSGGEHRPLPAGSYYEGGENDNRPVEGLGRVRSRRRRHHR